MYKKIDKIFGLLALISSFILYFSTMAPTTSFWDCGEFIATSYILGVPHPPGSPLFLLLGNVFSHMPILNDVGARVNLISPISSALSVMFLYHIIVYLIKEFHGPPKDLSDIIINNISALIAALTFAITDSQWFNAVESEVYALSTFFTAIVLWMILKWASHSNDKWDIRYLLLIAYMLGLAIGIHILNLLTLPFIALIIYFKKYDFSIKGLMIAMGLTGLVFVMIYSGVILGLPDIVSKFKGVNIIIFSMILITTAIVLLHISQYKESLSNLAKILSIMSVLFIALIMYNKLFIKGTTDLITVHENNIRTIDDTFYYYINQQEVAETNPGDIDYQYLEKLKKERAILFKDQQILDKKKDTLGFFGLLFWQSKFVILGFLLLLIGVPILFYFILWNEDNTHTVPLKVFLSCFVLIFIGYSTYTTIFIRANQHPRINENNPDNLDRALSYINRDQYGEITSFNPASAIKSSTSGHWKRWAVDKNNPTFREQVNFVWNYQIKEMYLRYFAWQFIGRSDKNEKPWLINDLNDQPVGNRKLDGIDFFRYGFPLAFLFGLFGIYFHFKRDWKRALAVLSVFLATGIMLVIYLNQYDPQPRERDYSYIGSFFAFAIWIGIGISFVQKKIKDFFKDSNISSFISISVSVFIFMLMTLTILIADYKEHSRRGNYVAWDYGYNLLNSCEPNAIIFTNGDNDTFPLWYLQEVENIRRDIRVVNLSLLNTPWYIEQLINDDPKLDLRFNSPVLLEDIYKIESDYLISTHEGHALCSQEFKGVIPWDFLDCSLHIDENTTFNFKAPSFRQQVLRIQDYMILQIIHDLFNDKPIYFAATVSENNQLGLSRYLQMEGMTYRLVSKKLPENIIDALNYDRMKLNLTQGALEDTIKTVSDYNNAILKNEGIYRYKNLNDHDMFFSGNIKRLVQNYRIGYLRMMQYQLAQNNLEEVNALSRQLNDYFPNDVLPIDPWLGFEILDKIFKPLNDIDNQKAMITHLVSSNGDINVKLIAIIKALELGHYGLTKTLINDYVAHSRMRIESKLALFFEIVNNIGYHSSIDPLIEDILNNNDIDHLSVNEKYSIFGVLYQIGHTQGAIKIGKSLLIKHYENDLQDVNTQKYVSDILLEVMGENVYIDFAVETFKNNAIEGMLYTLINAYKLNKNYDVALEELDSWIEKNPSNQRMINKRNNVLEGMFPQ